MCWLNTQIRSCHSQVWSDQGVSPPFHTSVNGHLCHSHCSFWLLVPPRWIFSSPLPLLSPSLKTTLQLLVCLVVFIWFHLVCFYLWQFVFSQNLSAEALKVAVFGNRTLREELRGWRGGSAVTKRCCSCRRPEFSIQMARKWLLLHLQWVWSLLLACIGSCIHKYACIGLVAFTKEDILFNVFKIDHFNRGMDKN